MMDFLERYKNIENFYERNHELLLEKDDLRPCKSVTRDIENTIMRFKSYYKSGKTLETKADVHDFFGREELTDTDNTNLRVMREFEFLVANDNQGYQFTEKFKDFVEEDILPGTYLLNELYSIKGLKDMTMYKNSLLCVLREGYSTGRVIKFPDSKEKFLRAVPDLNERNQYRTMVFKFYGFCGRSRTIDDSYTPNATDRLTTELTNLNLIQNVESPTNTHGFNEFNLTSNAYHLLDVINEQLGEEQKTNCLEVALVPRTIEEKKYPLNFIVYGAPGTGKTYSTAEYALAIIENRNVDTGRKTIEERKQIMDKYNNYIKNGQIVFTTFHQSYGYEEFIQGLRPDTESEHLSFKTVDGIFKKIADIALLDQEHKKYVIIIDEINRANISKVFGELITLIEEDKRWGEVDQTCATLQSGDIFAVPNNLYVIGTMNSADKSISLIDAALRRRFAFVEEYPNADLIDDPSLKAVFNKLNNILADSFESSDLLIGHSYFMNKTEGDLCAILNGNVIPLLYEYFYDNKKKVKSTLNDAINDIDSIRIEDNKFSRLRVIKEETSSE